MRKAFISALVELAEKDKHIWLLTADLGYGRLEPFIEKFPDRYLNVGIAESNMIGVATGLALRGKIVYVYSMSPFVTFRCFEQVRMMAHMGAHVIVVGAGRDKEYDNLGISHYANGDKELMSTLPMHILYPTTKEEVKNCVIFSYNSKTPSYLSLSK